MMLTVIEVKVNAEREIVWCSNPELLDRPYRRMEVRANGDFHKVEARKTTQTPRLLMDWFQDKLLASPKMGTAKDRLVAADIKADGGALVKFWVA
jgi:hypothetical protein